MPKLFTTAELFGGPPGDDEVSSYIIEAARKRGIPEQDALDVWAGEGKGAWQSNFRKGGKRERSYGPYQLYTDGGLGNAFQEETGLDPSDPATWKQGVDYALDTAKKEGWRQWYGAPARLRARGGYDETVAQAEPMRLGPAAGKKTFSTKELFGGPKQEAAPEAPTRAYPNPSHGGDLTIPEPKEYTPTPWGDISDDVQKTVISRTIGLGPMLAGLPGDILKGGEWLEGQLGINGGQNEVPIPGSQELGDKLVESGIDYRYTPTTGAGQLIGGGIDMAPASIGSKAGLVRQGATALGTGAAVDVAGDIGGPAAAVPAAIIASRKLSKPTLPKTPMATADDAAAATESGLTPVTEATKRITRDTYQASEDAGLRISGAGFDRLQQSIKTDPKLRKLDWNPKQFPKLAEVKAAIENQIKNPIWGRKDISLEEFDELRQKVGAAARSANRKEQFFAGRILQKMDEFYDNLSRNGALSTGDPKALKLLPQARKASIVSRKAEEIDRILEVAKNKAGQFSVSGNENAIKTGFRQLADRIAKDPRTRRLWTNDEIKAINQLARGTNSRFLMSRIGAGLTNPITMGLGGIGSAGTSVATNDPSWAIYNALGILGGYAAKGVGGRMAKTQANRARRLVQGGGNMSPPSASPAAAGLLALNQYLGQ
jgi:hypothetical protein